MLLGVYTAISDLPLPMFAAAVGLFASGSGSPSPGSRGESFDMLAVLLALPSDCWGDESDLSCPDEVIGVCGLVQKPKIRHNGNYTHFPFSSVSMRLANKHPYLRCW